MTAAESVAFGNAVFESSPDCVKLLDARGHVLRMNANGLCAMEIDDFLSVQGRPWSSLWPTDAQSEVQAALELAGSGGVGRFQRLCPTMKGTPRWWEVTVTRVPDVSATPNANEDLIAPRFISVSRDVTDKMRSAQELARSHRRFERIAQATPDIVYVFDLLDQKMAYVNEGVQQVLGFTPAQMAGLGDQVLARLIHPDDLPGLIEDNQRLAACHDGAVREIELRMRHADGSTRWICCRDAVFERAADGRASSLIGQAHDVTELHLRHQRTLLLADISARLVLLGKNGQRESADELMASVFSEVARHLGVAFGLNYAVEGPPETLRLVSTWGLDAAARRNFEHIGFADQLCGWVARTGKPVVVDDLQLATRHQASPMRALGATSYAGYPLLADGHLVGTMAFASTQRLKFSAEDHDLMQAVANLLAAALERDRLVAVVREAEEQFRTLADNIPQLAWIAQAGSNGQVSWFNKSWLDYTGASQAQMQGVGWHTVHHPDHAERVITKFAHHVKHGLDWEDTFPLRGRDGQYRWFLSRMNVIHNDAGAITRIFGTNTDITEQRLMAEQLQQQSADLSAAAVRKDQFLATLAHELRNPLAPIRHSLQLMRLTADKPEAVAQARLVLERQLSHLVRLVDDLLDASRINLDKLALHKEPLQLADVLNSAIEASLPFIHTKGLQLKLRLPAQPVLLQADLTRLSQVFINLLDNAAKFTPNGGHISLSAELAAPDVCVTISDSGIGMQAGELERIFDMFTQLDGSLDRAQGGLGIGLTLVRRLLDLHGGTVQAHSGGPGLGSQFVVRLPTLAQGLGPHAAAAVSTPAGALGSEPTTEPKKCRILVVDDNQDAATSLALLLEQMGHDTHTAHDGVAALDAALAYQPDVALLDIGLPRLSGLEVARRIRAEPWGRDMVLLALTGWGQDEDRQKSHDAGFDVHLVKPVDPAVLADLLTSACGGSA